MNAFQSSVRSLPKFILLTLSLLSPVVTKAQAVAAPPGYSVCTLDAYGNCNLAGPAMLAFGANSRFIFRTFPGPSTPCNVSVFGDPQSGGENQCFIPAEPHGFQACAVEGGACVFPWTITYAFGANGRYVFRSSSNGTGCNIAAFGDDPAPNVAKTCFVALPANYRLCAPENQACNFGTQEFPDVAYGANGSFVLERFNSTNPYSPDVTWSVCSTSNFFGVDPAPGVPKFCYIRAATAAAVPFGYRQCATEGAVIAGQNICTFTGTSNVAFGEVGNFVFKSFSNGVTCDVAHFGVDPAPGFTKFCFVPPDLPGYTNQCAAENSHCSFSGQATVAFGAAGHYSFLTLSNGTTCSAAVFGDPLPGVPKNCFLPTAPSGYQYCSTENETCHLTFGGTVYYGFDQWMTSLTVPASTSGVNLVCDNATFGFDPAPGVVKACFIVPAVAQ